MSLSFSLFFFLGISLSPMAVGWQPLKHVADIDDVDVGSGRGREGREERMLQRKLERKSSFSGKSLGHG